MAEAEFDGLIHSPYRLRICAIAHTASHVEFGELQDRLQISKSALSKHVSQLADSGYVEEQLVSRGGRSRLRLSLSEKGRIAYRKHIQALKEIIEAAQ